jgi:hypothetical protein
MSYRWTDPRHHPTSTHFHRYPHALHARQTERPSGRMKSLMMKTMLMMQTMQTMQMMKLTQGY